MTSVSSSLITVSSSLNTRITSVSSSIIGTIVTDANNKIIKPNNTPSAGSGLYLSQNYLGYYNTSAWNSYISSSGEFLFKKDDNNQISFGNNSFVLKVSDQATISGSNINLITPKFFLGGSSQFISGSNGKIEISSSNFHLDANGNVNMSGDINANTGIFKDVNIIGTIATSDNQTKYLLEPWITGSAELDALSGGDLARLSNIGTGGTTTSPYIFTIGRFRWNANIYSISSTTGLPNTTPVADAVTWFSAVTGSNFNTYQNIDTATTFDYSAIGNSSLYSTSGTPLTFDNWGHIVGYSSGEYGKNAQGNFLTASSDSIIFNVAYNATNAIRSSIITDTITIDNVNFTSSANPDSLVLQLQSKFINNIPNWIYATNTSTGQPGPKMHDCKFIIEILNSNSVVLLSDSRIQNSESEWIDFNIPLTALLLQTKSLISSNYYSNRLKIRLSWEVIKHKLPLNHTAGTAPPQVRITEMRIVSIPTSIGLSTSTIKFADSYLSSMNSGTAVQGNLIPVDDSKYDLGSANQNPDTPDHTSLSNTLFATSVAEKRWNNIYGKFLSADTGISVGSSIILQPSSSIAVGLDNITAGTNSHAEGLQTRTGKFKRVYNASVDLSKIYNLYPNLPDNTFDSIDFSKFCYISAEQYGNEVTLGVTNIQTIVSGSATRRVKVLDTNIQCSASISIIVPLTGGSLTGTYYGPDTPEEEASFTFYALRYVSASSYAIYNKQIYEFSQLNNINGNAAHSEGAFTIASGQYSHAEGSSSFALGQSSHAEGWRTTAVGNYSHAEGSSSFALGHGSHVEGWKTQASGTYSHAEGTATTSIGKGAHAEGFYTIASGSHSHAEGYYTIASSSYSHAEGYKTITYGQYTHAEGIFTTAWNGGSHAEGYYTKASGSWSHAEGYTTCTIGLSSHTEGRRTTASGDWSHAEGYLSETGNLSAFSASISSGIVTINSVYGNVTKSFDNNGILVLYDVAQEYTFTKAKAEISRSFFNTTNTIVELYDNTITTSLAYVGDISQLNLYTWTGDQIMPANYSHAEGYLNITIGDSSHAEGIGTLTYGAYSHAEGYSTLTLGQYSHAEGSNTIPIGAGSHTEGYNTVALGDYQHVQGQYNISSSAQSAFIVGNGTSLTSRRNLIFASGSEVQITGSLLLKDILVLAPRTTRPAQSTTLTGSIMMSGSAGANLGLYVYTGVSTGNGWQRVTLT